MSKTANDQQRKYFDIEKHQYSQDLISKPPLHTQLETNQIICRLKGIDKNSFIIDFGSGTGRITIPLLKNYSVLSVDISNESLTNLKKLAKNIPFRRLRVSTTLPRANKFKAVVGADILHHVDLDYYLPIIHELLEEEGKVVFSEPGGLNPTWYIYLPLFHDWTVEKGVQNCTYHNLGKIFKKYRFRKIKISGLGFFPRPFFNWSRTLCNLNDSLGSLPILKFFAYRYIIEATK